MSPEDKEELEDPETNLLANNGCIFLAFEGETLVGSSGLSWDSDESAWKLAKVCVVPSQQRKGTGRALVEACLAAARERKAQKVILYSNHQLEAACRLYSSLGFVQAPVPASMDDPTADVYMELIIQEP
jgi:ribosomal protein S18 acetylase RimI-like enzyme